jgi:hypothetical protein
VFFSISSKDTLIEFTLITYERPLFQIRPHSEFPDRQEFRIEHYSIHYRASIPTFKPPLTFTLCLLSLSFRLHCKGNPSRLVSRISLMYFCTEDMENGVEMLHVKAREGLILNFLCYGVTGVLNSGPHTF